MLRNRIPEILVSARLPELQTQTFQHPEGTLAYTDYGSRGELVLISTFAREQKPNPFMKAMSWFKLNNPWRAKTWRMFYRTLFPTRKPMDIEDYMDQLTENLSQAGRFEAVKAFPSLPRQPGEECLAHVKAPVLVVMGTQDPGFPRPGDGLVLIEGAGHYPQTEMPEKTAPAVLNFHRQA